LINTNEEEQTRRGGPLGDLMSFPKYLGLEEE